MGFSERVAGARASSGGGVYLTSCPDGKPAKYTLVVSAIKHVAGAMGNESFVVELEVAASTNPERPEGTDVAWVQRLDKPGADGRIKSFFLAIKPGAETFSEAKFGAMIDEACSPANPFMGTAICAQVGKVRTRSGTTIDAVTWSSADE